MIFRHPPVDSTHGTFLNKSRIKPRTYVRIKVGHQLKFGNSTRNYILQGPLEDEDAASDLSITELKEQKVQREAEMRQKEVDEKLAEEKKEEEGGVSWGIADDAEDEPDLNENPFAVTNNEELFLDDPKKTLRGFFEREGYDLEYKCDELSPGVFICRVELPIDDEYGKNIICEVQHKGKKKECVVQCALEACRILDRHGVLRQANHEPRRSKKLENDDDDSDDDIFFDRTGDVEKKRLKKLGSTPSEVFTYEQLMEQEKDIVDKIQTLEHKLELMVQLEKRQKMETDDDLDQFMSNLSNMDQKVDKFAISSTKIEIQNLKTERLKVQKLVNIAKPSMTLPPIAPMKGRLPLFGKRNALSRNFGLKKSDAAAVHPVIASSNEAFNVEEEEEEESTKKIEMEKTKVETDKVNAKSEEIVKKHQEKDSSKEGSEVQKRALKEGDERTEPAEKKSKLEDPTVQPAIMQESSSKKRKNRIRRNRLRENIDMNDDDEYIDEEKVSTWVAPQDQTGDGTTHLNQKFGY